SVVQTPLGKVCDILVSEYGCNVRLDTRSLTDAGVATDLPCDLTVKDASLEDALSQLLARRGLKVAVHSVKLALPDFGKSVMKVAWMLSNSRRISARDR